VLGSADGRKDAFVNPVDGFYFDIAQLDVVQRMRYRTVEGFAEDPAGDRRPVEKLHAAPAACSYDYVLPNTALAFVRRVSPEYVPGMSLIGWHRYMRGGLAFGWRPPVQIKVDQPHVQDLWIVPHGGELAAYADLDRACRTPLVVAEPKAIRERAAERLRQMETLQQAAQLPGAPSTMAAAVTGAASCFSEASRAEDGTAQLLEGEQALGQVDLAASARAIAKQLRQETDETPVTGREPAPWRSLVGQARACVAAAAWDLATDHEARGIPRLGRAARLYQAARDYAARAPQRIVPATAPKPLCPYVTFSEGASPALSFVGFDVGHFWVPWGHWFEQLELEPKPGEWNWAEADKLFGDASEAGMAVIPLLNFAPPRWWSKQFEPPKDAAGAPPGSTGDTRLVSPELLGRVPPHMEAFAEYIRQVSARYGSRGNILAWSVRNEPAYYETGGLNGPLMREAFDHWIHRRYPGIAELNANWGTSFADFGSVQPPERWEQNRAAWYDLMTFKAECLNGELNWEADLAMANSPVKYSGAKFVPACSGPQSARSGYGVDPWLTAGAQRGVAFADLYLDDERMAALRAAELSWGAGGVPVISCETGRSSRPVERIFRWHYTPDRRARSLPWMLLQFGLYGTHYWTWTSGEEYACLDSDGALCDFGLEAALANAEMRALRPALAGARPVVDVGLLYPRASFVQGDRATIEAYQNLYLTLVQCGYQVRLVAPSDFDRVAPALSHILVPPAPYLETSLVEGFRRYVEAGGKLIVTGNPGRFDEYARPRPEGLDSLTGARVASDTPQTMGRVQIGRRAIAVGGQPDWLSLAPDRAQVKATGATEGEAATPVLTSCVIGKGQVWWLGMNSFQSPGDGGRVPLPGKWRFAFGDQWPQAPGQGTTSTEGHTDRGTAERWFAAQTDDSRWEEVAIPGVWEDNGHPDLDGWGWYRAHFALPLDVRGKRLVLAGDTLDDRGRVYVNGTLVQETTNWDAVWRTDVTQLLHAEGDNVIAIRVEDTCLLGGIRGNVALLCPDLPSVGEAVLPLVLQMTDAPRTLSGGPTGVYRTVLANEEGNRYLVISNLSGAAARFGLTVYGVAKALTEYTDLLSGDRMKGRADGGNLVLEAEIEPDGVRVLKL